MDTPKHEHRGLHARTDAIASAVVVATMIASALCGAFAVDVESTTPRERSVVYLAHAE